MSFRDQVVVVLGATGIVGSGVAKAYLDAGAIVVAVSRSAKNLEALRQKLQPQPGQNLLEVVGDFGDAFTATETHRAVSEVLGGKQVSHVVCCLGSISLAKAPTATTIEAFRGAFDDGLFNIFHAAKVFLPGMKNRPGSTFTLTSGGLAHIAPPDPSLWLGTVKNAAVNALAASLASETRGDAVRVNTICIHFAVAGLGGHANRFGAAAEKDTTALAPAYLAVARGTHKGQLICLSSFADVERMG